MATIELYFKPATSVSGGGADEQGVASHAFLIYRNDAGQITGYSRGGPEVRDTNNPQGPGVFGYIVTDHGAYTSDTKDYIPSAVNTQGYIVQGYRI